MPKPKPTKAPQSRHAKSINAAKRAHDEEFSSDEEVMRSSYQNVIRILMGNQDTPSVPSHHKEHEERGSTHEEVAYPDDCSADVFTGNHVSCVYPPHLLAWPCRDLMSMARAAISCQTGYHIRQLRRRLTGRPG